MGCAAWAAATAMKTTQDRGQRGAGAADEDKVNRAKRLHLPFVPRVYRPRRGSTHNKRSRPASTATCGGGSE
jgi:hypothetical protein